MSVYPRSYYVSSKNVTDYEPISGWYVTYEHPYDSAPMIIYCGDYASTLDYTEGWLEEERDRDDE